MKISLVSLTVQDPIEAHEIYTTKLGFPSKEYDPELSLAVVASPEDPGSTQLLLEPCQGTFAETFQQEAYKSNLAIMIFSDGNVDEELERLKAEGISLRPDLDKPDWGMTNLFEDGCGNLLMIQEASS